MPAQCQRLLVAATGSIHVVQLPWYLSQLRRDFCDEVQVAMTASAASLSSPLALAQFSGAHVHTDQAVEPAAAHLGLVGWAEMVLVLPATADILGKAASGIATDLVSTLILSAGRGVVFAPAMNTRMWDSRPVRRNLETLQADGHHVVWPQLARAEAADGGPAGMAPTVDKVLQKIRQARMVALRAEVWQDAIKEHPRAHPAASADGNRSETPKREAV